MSTQELLLKEMIQIRQLSETHQLLMAKNFVEELTSLSPDLNIDEMTILDALACAGLSLTIGEYASRTYMDLVRLEK